MFFFELAPPQGACPAENCPAAAAPRRRHEPVLELTSAGGCAVARAVRRINMANFNPRRGKPYLSEHQKQIRFFIRLSIGLSLLLALAIFLLLNWSSFSPR
jgi:hypothetical protein